MNKILKIAGITFFVHIFFISVSKNKIKQAIKKYFEERDEVDPLQDVTGDGLQYAISKLFEALNPSKNYLLVNFDGINYNKLNDLNLTGYSSEKYYKIAVIILKIAFGDKYIIKISEKNKEKSNELSSLLKSNLEWK